MKNKSTVIRTKVDIITPVYGQLHLVKKLVESIQKYTAGVSYHWYIIDDATPENRSRLELLSFLRKLAQENANITFIQNNVNGGFAKSNNLAAAKGHSDYILLLNSDTKVTEDGWLAKLTKHLDDNVAIGIVGAKLLFFEDSKDEARPAGTIQHAGVAFNIHGHPYHIFMSWPSDHPKVNQTRIMRAVTDACLLTRRKLWRQLGGLNEIYGQGNFEDVEYCIRAFAMGNLIVYEPNVMLYHYGSGSGNTEAIERNGRIFLLRNKELLV